MSHLTDANELLMSGGVKAVKFETLGDTALGTITDQPKVAQMKKYQTDELDFWPSGDPKMQIIVTIATAVRDPGNPADDGRRLLFIPPRMMQPVREAIQATGAKGLAIGGRIAVRWVSGTGKGEGNPKVYAAEYAPPAVDPGSLLGNGTQPAPTTPAAVAPPAAAPPPSTGMLTTSTTAPAAQAGPPPGVDPAIWAGLPDQQRQVILAAMTTAAGFDSEPPF
jgi:hypothetical protein